MTDFYFGVLVGLWLSIYIKLFLSLYDVLMYTTTKNPDFFTQPWDFFGFIRPDLEKFNEKRAEIYGKESGEDD